MDTSKAFLENVSAPAYVAGVFVCPFDPFMVFKSPIMPQGEASATGDSFDPGDSTTPMAHSSLDLYEAVLYYLKESLYSALAQVSNNIYVVYPVEMKNGKTVHGERGLCDPQHAAFLYDVYSALNSAACQLQRPEIQGTVLSLTLETQGSTLPSAAPSKAPPCGVDTTSGPTAGTAAGGIPHESAVYENKDVRNFQRTWDMSLLQIRELETLLSLKDSFCDGWYERRTEKGPVALFYSADETLRAYTTVSSMGCDGVAIGQSLLEVLRDIYRPLHPTLVPIRVAYKKGVLPLEPLLGREIFSTRRCSVQQMNKAVLGGTFDHLHFGHQFLLGITAVCTTRHLLIGVVDDEGDLLSKKQHATLLQPLPYRLRSVYQLLRRVYGISNRRTQLKSHVLLWDIDNERPDCPKKTEFNLSSVNKDLSSYAIEATENVGETITIELDALRDPIGMAGYRDDLDCLFVTEETEKGGSVVNHYRKDVGRAPLRLVVLPLLRTTTPTPCPREQKNVQVYAVPEPNNEPCGQEVPVTRMSEVHEQRLSSTYVRGFIEKQYGALELMASWLCIAQTLQFPRNVASFWGIRLVGLLARPWRHSLRVHVLSAWKGLIDVPSVEPNTSDRPLCVPEFSVVRAWWSVILGSIALCLPLCSCIARPQISFCHQREFHKRLSHEKLARWLFGFFSQLESSHYFDQCNIRPELLQTDASSLTLLPSITEIVDLETPTITCSPVTRVSDDVKAASFQLLDQVFERGYECVLQADWVKNVTTKEKGAAKSGSQTL